MPRLPPNPDLTWAADGTPMASAFSDVYYSRAGGLAEAEAVFLVGCALPGAWTGRERFAVFELGFGSGLNVLALWRAWKKTRSPHAQLHISTVEAFPLAVSDAARALDAFPEISDLAEQLLARWPVRAATPQRLWFPADGLSLTVHVGAAASVLPHLEGRFDAWFLDGFAPARNPEMWSPELMREIARLSAPGARLATFTVAGEVRRGLEAAGFSVEKRAGFGAKRERLEARLTRPPLQGFRSAKPFPYASANPGRVAVLGAGVAGAACAQALVRRGVETIVLDAAPEPASAASGNPAGLVMPRLDRGGTLQSFWLAAYLHAVAAYEALGAFERCGVEQRSEPRSAEALADLLADPPLPPDWFAATPVGDAMHLRAGLVRPGAAIGAMLCGAHFIGETEIRTLTRSGQGWALMAPDGRAMLRADAVVLACGAALTVFEPARFLPIALSRGQIEWGEGATPAHAITRGHYVAPLADGVLFGAGFDAYGGDPTDPIETDSDARDRNIAALRTLAPQIADGLRPETLRSRAALRATTPDRAPIVGLLPDAERWLAQYACLADGGRPESDLPPPAHDGVYVIGGLGARGLTTAPLLGEMIAGEMCGEPEMFSRSVRDALHPARFLLRALKRR